MALIPTVIEVSRDTETGMVYVLAEFRRRVPGPVVLREEFLMQLTNVGYEAIVDTNGEVIGQREVALDIRAEMRRNLANFAAMAEAKGLTGDLRQVVWKRRDRLRDEVDERGLLAKLRPEVGR